MIKTGDTGSVNRSARRIYANEFVTCTLMYKLFIILLANFRIYP